MDMIWETKEYENDHDKHEHSTYLSSFRRGLKPVWTRMLTHCVSEQRRSPIGGVIQTPLFGRYLGGIWLPWRYVIIEHHDNHFWPAIGRYIALFLDILGKVDMPPISRSILAPRWLQARERRLLWQEGCFWSVKCPYTCVYHRSCIYMRDIC